MDFHHLGIATRDAQAVANTFEPLFDAPLVHEESVDGLAVSFLELGDGYLELLEPVESDGPVARFLDREGPGIHHVAVETADLEGAIRTASESGVRLIDEEPRAGAWGHDVAFLHPDSTGGVLVEFVET